MNLQYLEVTVVVVERGPVSGQPPVEPLGLQANFVGVYCLRPIVIDRGEIRSAGVDTSSAIALREADIRKLVRVEVVLRSGLCREIAEAVFESAAWPRYIWFDERVLLVTGFSKAASKAPLISDLEYCLPKYGVAFRSLRTRVGPRHGFGEPGECGPQEDRLIQIERVTGGDCTYDVAESRTPIGCKA